MVSCSANLSLVCETLFFIITQQRFLCECPIIDVNSHVLSIFRAILVIAKP